MGRTQCIEALKEEIAELKRKLTAIELAGIKKRWEPCGGEWYVTSDGRACNSRSEDSSRLFGVERQTEALAEKAAEEMHKYNRLLAYVAEFDPDWEVDWDDYTKEKFYVYKDMDTTKQWRVGCNTYIYYPAVVHMSEECAKDLARKLNSGEVVI